MKNIILAGLIFDNNLGDQAIYQSTLYMVNKILQENKISDIEIRGIDITGRDGIESNHLLRNVVRRKFNVRVYHKLSVSIYNDSKAPQKINIYEIKQLTRLLCADNIDNETAAVIFVGGGIVKYKYQFFHYYINEITKYADKRNIPVMFSAVGVEGYDSANKDCIMLKKAINRDCVKMITTRDDIETLRTCYCKNRSIITQRVADPACSLEDVYSIVTRTKTEKKVIGLGCVREGLFIDNDINFDKQGMLKLWSGIYKELISRGYDCRLFCNGARSDQKFIYELVEFMDIHNNADISDRPTNVNELIDIISDCDAVVVGRLHASIIAYSYNIPSVGLVWNDKQTMFGECIGFKDRFISIEKFNADYIVDVLEKVLEEGYNDTQKNNYCKTTQLYLEMFIKEYVKNRR